MATRAAMSWDVSAIETKLVKRQTALAWACLASARSDRSEPRLRAAFQAADCINQQFSLERDDPPRKAVRTSRSLVSLRVSHSQMIRTW